MSQPAADDPDTTPRQLMHASALQVRGMGILLRGPSGSGKSDLALRLMDRGHRLISDDQVILQRRGEGVRLSPPEVLRGQLEIRGIGILRIDDIVQDSLLAAVIDLEDRRDIDRLPPESECVQVLGLPVPRYHLDPTDPSAAIKVEIMMDLTLNRRWRTA